MQPFLTKCPHCLTTFKVEKQQLEAAAGAVRCGACLSVFNAHEHMTKESTLLPAASARSTGTQASTQLATATKEELLDDSAIHWTQALGNDVDKIYEYLAKELDLNSDPELAQKLQHDQWGRDLLAELDDQTATQASAPLPVQPVDFIEAGQEEQQETEQTDELTREIKVLTDKANTAQFNTAQNSEIHHVDMPTFDDTLDEQLLDLPNTFEPLGETSQVTGLTTPEAAPATPPLTKPQSPPQQTIDIVPSFVDPVGLEKTPQQPTINPPENILATHHDVGWHEDILQELEKQSRNIAASIHSALGESQLKDTRKEPEYSLKDLENLPLRADKIDSAKLSDEAQTASQEPENTQALAPQAPLHTQDITSETPESSIQSLDQEDDLAKKAQKESLERLDASLKAELSQEVLAHISQQPPRRFDWSALGAIALASFALVGQIAFFEAEHLSQDRRFRPLYEQICKGFGCTIRPLENFSKIHIATLHVRDHPTDNMALIVDANLQNDADFPQPFPDIELTFSDKDDRPIARRRFKPEEYRGETLKNFPLLPAQQRVHIVLEIVDPNPNGILNYRHKLYKGNA